jgi:hypothetical protein
MTTPITGSPSPGVGGASTDLNTGGISPNVGQSIAIVEQLGRDGTAMAVARFKADTMQKPAKFAKDGTSLLDV